MDVLLANPRGFCAGVDRAIEIVERVLQRHGAPLYVRHEVVHNRYVVETLKARGVIFIEEIAEVPAGAVCVFSAHGVSLSVRQQAEERGLQLYDATCPLVTKVHLEVARHCREGADVVLIGHRGHPEVEGTLGQCRDGEGRMHLIETVEDVASLEVRDPQRVCYVTQTTLSVEDSRAMIAALKARFPALQGPKKSDICYATQNRQDAVRELAARVDLMLVVGSVTSSNSNRLRELASAQGITAFLIDDAEEIDPQWLVGQSRVAVTAGASAPELLVQQVIERLRTLGAESVEECRGVSEEVVFALPKSLG
ncbi:4-hydroxy-3-methylbut-2-enyl diphosphate reductase [Rhabdochromatium marinum]|uniref:4-hydroxy-3-methylbut-2-enyl diphosphate reductase n=1 Tax=Rhabdochromatium marinum TaxID=48729 RepID=UPI001905CEC6|nr:4-hydroxy-3-methylbut-2-enyl diphosphate reductase [Rhabdochromatium marinum]MBK1647629.1 4-hydroxy-3-methylbut-2-enyl diphosphate reductase [Rhabdochromatium marinum]